MKKKSEQPFEEASVAVIVRGRAGNSGWRRGMRLEGRGGGVFICSRPGAGWDTEATVGKKIKLLDGEKGVAYTVSALVPLFPAMPECSLATLVDTVEHTGGLTYDPDGYVIPVADDWLDLAHAYLQACVNMDKKALVDGKYKSVRSLNALSVLPESEKAGGRKSV